LDRRKDVRREKTDKIKHREGPSPPAFFCPLRNFGAFSGLLFFQQHPNAPVCQVLPFLIGRQDRLSRRMLGARAFYVESPLARFCQMAPLWENLKTHFGLGTAAHQQQARGSLLPMPVHQVAKRQSSNSERAHSLAANFFHVEEDLGRRLGNRPS